MLFQTRPTSCRSMVATRKKAVSTSGLGMFTKDTNVYDSPSCPRNDNTSFLPYVVQGGKNDVITSAFGHCRRTDVLIPSAEKLPVHCKVMKGSAARRQNTKSHLLPCMRVESATCMSGIYGLPEILGAGTATLIFGLVNTRAC